MISKKWEPAFSFEGARHYIFIMECHEEPAEVPQDLEVSCKQETVKHYHFFIFDEVGGCSESRLFCHPVYLRQIEETVLLTESGKRRPVWELEPHGEPGYPAPWREPVLQQIVLNKEGHLCLDKLYAMETLRTDAFRAYTLTDRLGGVSDADSHAESAG